MVGNVAVIWKCARRRAADRRGFLPEVSSQADYAPLSGTFWPLQHVEARALAGTVGSD